MTAIQRYVGWDHALLNQYLWGITEPSEEERTELDKFNAELSAQMDGLRAFKGQVYRAIDAPDFNGQPFPLRNYSVGDTIEFKGYTSTSKTKEAFAQRAKVWIEPPVSPGAKAVFLSWITNSGAGKDLGRFSETHEQEVLFKPGLRLNILRKRLLYDGRITAFACEEEEGTAS